IGLLTSYHLLHRSEPLYLYAPKGLKEIIELNFKYSDTRLVYPLIYHELSCDKEELIYETDLLTITTIPMKHRIPCCGFLFREKIHDRKIIGEKLTEYNIPVSVIPDLKKGKDLQLG